MKPLFAWFGILNLFNINRINGTYWLDLSIFEERIVAKVLTELAKIEGFDKIKFFRLNGKPV